MDVLRVIKHDHPKLPILVLSMHPEDQYGIRALKAGAEGYMTKESVPAELVKAIRKIVNGGKYVSPALAEKIAFVFTEKDPERSLHEKLSDREYQILRMIASGKSVGEIAAELFLSPKTISTYCSRILNKMGMKNNAELIHYAIQNRLV
jgi:two-component system invasion response regulator UvrY